MDASIKTDDLSFRYLHGDEEALRGINLSIPRNKVTAIVGPVGAGKTTLLLTLNGLIPQYIPGYMSGKVFVEGLDVSEHETEDLAGNINLLFDDPVLQIVGLTVEEDVAFGPANMGLSREEVWNRVQTSLEQLRLSGYETRNPRQLSGGEMQLLAMAGVFAMRPNILAMDEPVAMLDPVGKKMVFDAIRNINIERGLTTVVTDSGADIESVCEFADHMILMHKGEIVDEGDPSRLLAERDVIEKTTLRIPQVTKLFWQIDPAKEEVPVRLDQAEKSFKTSGLHFSISARRAPFLSENEVETGEVLVEARNIRHTYQSVPPVEALRGVDLSIGRGELIALLGQNGSGKTTLALHLVGILKPSNQDAVVDVAGIDVTVAPLHEIIRHINYVFQNPYNQLFNETFREEVEYGPRQLKLEPEEVERRARDSLAAVGLLDLIDYYQASLTRSEATLLGLASVLSLNPDVIIADEPTKGLDEPAAEKVLEVLRQRCAAGASVLMITHDMELAARHATRIAVMSQGKIIIDDKPRKVFSNRDALDRAFLTPPQISRLALKLVGEEQANLPLTPEEFMLFIGRSGN